MRRVSVHQESWRSRTPFRTTGHEVSAFGAVVVTILDRERTGRGEGYPIHYLGETLDGLTDQLESILAALVEGASRQDLLGLLPPGGARNAVDAALWDLEAQLGGVDVWKLCGVEAAAVETVFTIGLEATPEAMAAKAAQAADLPLLKIKLNGDRPLQRIEAIRRARPDARLVVDANQGWSFAQLCDIAPGLAELGVLMIEQPLPRGADAPLQNYRSPLPLCADESCQHLGELNAVAARYQVINIKLDKTGGLTHAMALADAAKALGLDIMVGCMCGTSLAMAPVHVLAQRARFVDIDGPLLLRNDRLDGLVYDRGSVRLGTARLWGR